MVLPPDLLAERIWQYNPALEQPSRSVVKAAMEKVIAAIEEPPYPDEKVDPGAEFHKAYVFTRTDTRITVYQLTCHGGFEGEKGSLRPKGNAHAGLTIEGYQIDKEHGGRALDDLSILPRDPNAFTWSTFQSLRGINPVALDFLSYDLRRGFVVTPRVYEQVIKEGSQQEMGR
jgi:hypothetical protein